MLWTDTMIFKNSSPLAAIIGGGPAGLMAAEVLADAGIKVNLYDAMPSMGRKFLLAGKGGLNLTHAEPFELFVSRYGQQQSIFNVLLNQFSPQQLCDWSNKLGIITFVGSSQRVFPLEMKAAPLLRAWLRRLRASGVSFYPRHRWLGWNEQHALRFETTEGEKLVAADAVILALGGGSWAKLGSDGAWIPLLTEHDIAIAPLQPSNCGFNATWSEYFCAHYAGQPLKSIGLSFTDDAGTTYQQRGELMLTANGVEGSLIYAHSSVLRDNINAVGHVTIYLDLMPDKNLEQIQQALSQRSSQSISNRLRRLGLDKTKIVVLREILSKAQFADCQQLASAIKALPIRLLSPRPLDEAISSAGGVKFEALTDNLMLKALPGVFCAGEMLDWEAPTGGYLLTGCFATGRAAGLGALAWLQSC